MSFAKVYELLDALDLRHRSETEKLNKRIGELSAEVNAQKMRVVEAQEKTDKARQAQDVAESKVGVLEQKIVTVRASVASEVEKLRAEKELLSQRDREARDELDRLHYTKIGNK